MSRVLRIGRLVCTALLLVAVYEGSRLALVVVLALIVIASELQVALWRRFVTEAHETMLRAVAFRTEGERRERIG